MVALHRTIPAKLTERILQIGEGVFLRGFVDWMFDKLNKEQGGDFGVVVVQPRAGGHCAELQEQDGLFTLCMHGNDAGQAREETVVVESIVRTVNPYVQDNWMETVVHNPALRFIVSNTTEAGIEYVKGQETFPSRMARLLQARFEAGMPGFDFLPCELIDNNAAALRSCILQYAADFAFSPACVHWIETQNVFHNTLVDRIVTGFPKDSAEAEWQKLGYVDNCLDTCEWFHLWVIEGDETLARALPFAEAGLNVKFVPDVTPYKTRKVRILNGAHTAFVPAALLCGYETVYQAMHDDVIRPWLMHTLEDEIIPTMTLPRAELQAFAQDVICRFDNPYIAHRLSAICMNSISKWRARILPTLADAYAACGTLPPHLTFSLAALIQLYRGGFSDDTPAAVEKMKNLPLADLLADADLWGRDLSFMKKDVEAFLYAMETYGVRSSMAQMNGGERG